MTTGICVPPTCRSALAARSEEGDGRPLTQPQGVRLSQVADGAQGHHAGEARHLLLGRGPQAELAAGGMPDEDDLPGQVGIVPDRCEGREQIGAGAGPPTAGHPGSGVLDIRHVVAVISQSLREGIEVLPVDVGPPEFAVDERESHVSNAAALDRSGRGTDVVDAAVARAVGKGRARSPRFGGIEDRMAHG